MKHGKISLRRRHLMIAGLAGVAAPAAIHAAGQSQGLNAEISAAEDMVVSGRILDADGKPAFNAVIELWQPGAAERATATTDGDGRFFTPLAGSGKRHIHYRVIHAGQRTRTNRLDVARDAGAHLQRDDAGLWRTTFGHTLA